MIPPNANDNLPAEPALRSIELGLERLEPSLARLSGVSFGKAAVWVFGLWAAFTGLMVGIGAAVRSVFGG